MKTTDTVRVKKCKCGTKPSVEMVEFYGERYTKWEVVCPKCGERNIPRVDPARSVFEWNAGRRLEHRHHDPIDNDGPINMLGAVIEQAVDDYVTMASKKWNSDAEIREMVSIEEFIADNPYALPYDRMYVIEEMKREAQTKHAERAEYSRAV